uniref:SFRICE_018286 n=1 Tax=Spodoptera frugiperda TaxID=7108 RepID=A0A2H1VNI8_SPOFR
MANDGLKNKSDLNLDEVPVKKMRLDTEKDSVLTRTVATMCGAWRPEEEYGGLVFVFKTRDPGLSPNPTNEADYPENIEDFWEATFPSSDDEQHNFVFKQKIRVFALATLSTVASGHR